MPVSCPVVHLKVDAYQLRLQALLIALLALGFSVTLHPLFTLFLAYDFAVRLFISPRGSLLFWGSRGVIRVLGIPTNPVDAGPKRFAAKIGLLLILAANLALLFGAAAAAGWLTGILAFFAALEALFNFCVGCRLYVLLLPLLNRGSNR